MRRNCFLTRSPGVSVSVSAPALASVSLRLASKDDYPYPPGLARVASTVLAI